MKPMTCECCKKPFGRNGFAILFSGSLSGNSCSTYLCKKCINNKNKHRKMLRINDWKLDVMDGVKNSWEDR